MLLTTDANESVKILLILQKPLHYLHFRKMPERYALILILPIIHLSRGVAKYIFGIRPIFEHTTEILEF